MRGLIIRQRYRGLSQAQMAALANDYILSGLSCQLVYNQGDTATLEILDATNSYTIDSWQIVGNEECRDVLSHPTILNLLTENEIGQIREGLNNVPSSSTPADDIVSPLGLGSGDAATVTRFVTLALSGQSEYRRAQYVLRHTTNVPNRWTVNIADFGIEQIYTTAQLLTEVQNAALWIFPLPYRMAYKISNIGVPIARSNYLWGWLKGPSTETTAANNRIEINQEYCLEQWSTDDYAPY